MATQQGILSAQVTDAIGITATTDAFVEIDDTKTVAQLLSDALDYADTVQGLSQGNVTEYSVKVLVRITPGGPAAGDVEKGALFNFNNASDPYAQGYWIADVSPSILDTNGLINLTNTNVTNFITFMTTAHTVITVVTKGVRALSSLRDALISFRKHRKALTRKTKEV